MQGKLGIIIQARTGSTRLPNKMLLPFYSDKGIFELLLERLVLSDIDCEIIVATTIQNRDNSIVDIASKYNCIAYRGDENNVLSRFVEAATQNNITKIIRICADNPFIDLQSLKNQIEIFRQNDIDYLCYSLSDGKPTILTHYGFWAEAVSLNALKKVQKKTNEKLYIEHVTNYIYTHTEFFSIEKKIVDKEIENKNIRLTIDTQADFDLAKIIYEILVQKKCEINIGNILNIINTHPEWLFQMKSQIEKNIK